MENIWCSKKTGKQTYWLIYFPKSNLRFVFVFVLVWFFSPGVSVSASPSLQSKGNVSFSGNRRLFFDTHALVCLLEQNGNLLEMGSYFQCNFESGSKKPLLQRLLLTFLWHVMLQLQFYGFFFYFQKETAYETLIGIIYYPTCN